MKFLVYCMLSFAGLVATVYRAYVLKQQFYPTVLFLVTSKFSLLVAGNFAVAIALVCARFLKSIFFGQLRDNEVEILIEKAKYTVVDTCLALTIFRNNLSGPLLVLFVFLIFMKLLHRLARARLEYMDQISPIPRLMSARMCAVLIIAAAVDVAGAYYAFSDVRANGTSVLILFGFEFGLLNIYVLNLALRFVLQLIESFREHEFPAKGFYVMIVDLVSEALKLITNVAFFVVVFQQYGFPIHLIRDLFAAYSSFHRKFLGFLKYWQLVSDLDSKFPNATAEELQNVGDCLVCRESMSSGKKLPCGHVFHFDCLKSWLQHQQTCPLCRSEINTRTVAPETRPPENAVPNEQAIAQNRNDAAAAVPGEHAEPIAEARTEGVSLTIPQDLPSTAPLRSNISIQLIESDQKQQMSAGLYLVSSAGECAIHSQPSNDSALVRKVLSGTILFVNFCVLDAQGVRWLRTTEGWIREFSSSASDCCPQLTPLLRKSSDGESTMSTSAASPPSAAMPFAVSSQPSPIGSTSSRNQKDWNFMTSGSSQERLRDIRNLQLQLQDMATTMNQLSTSMLMCQQSVSRLVNEEIAEAAAHNLKMLDNIQSANVIEDEPKKNSDDVST